MTMLPAFLDRPAAIALAIYLLAAFGAVVFGAVTAHAADPLEHASELPAAMQGAWSIGDEDGNHERVPNGESADFYVGKTEYSGVDTECKIAEAKRLSDNRCQVRAHCQIADDPASNQWHDLVEFELRGDVLHVEDINS
jgi:hypothetical protein